MTIPMSNDRTSDIPFSVIDAFPFDLIALHGNDAVDFLQRMSTNDFSHFSEMHVQHTLFISEKGRMIDTVWVIKKNDSLILAVSHGKSDVIMQWMNRYIIMEDLVVENVTGKHSVAIHFTEEGQRCGIAADFFTFPVYFELRMNKAPSTNAVPASYESWRIYNGIPAAEREIVQEYNPLELSLRDWISFTKGCYIGQEVIARLDTYNKVQRALFRFRTRHTIVEHETLCDDAGAIVGKITSTVKNGGDHLGLAVIKTKEPNRRCIVQSQSGGHAITLDPVLREGSNGRN